MSLKNIENKIELLIGCTINHELELANFCLKKGNKTIKKQNKTKIF